MQNTEIVRICLFMCIKCKGRAAMFVSICACLPADGGGGRTRVFVYSWQAVGRWWRAGGGQVQCRWARLAQKMFYVFACFHRERYSVNICHHQDSWQAPRLGSDAVDWGATCLGGWRPIKVTLWRCYWQREWEVYYTTLNWQQMETFAHCSSKDKYNLSILFGCPWFDPIVHMCKW